MAPCGSKNDFESRRRVIDYRSKSCAFIGGGTAACDLRELIVVGVATEWCALFTAMDAYVRGYSLWVPADCVASESRERHQAALLYMEQVLGADVGASDGVNDRQLPAQGGDLHQRPST